MPEIELSIKHDWTLSPDEAIRLQNELRQRVRATPLPLESIHSVGGIDVGFRQGLARCAVVVLSYPGLQVVEQVTAEAAVPMPYIPGLLSFRETPAILAALARLKALPGVLICDGQGFAHPRRFGIACHLGVLLDHPSVGCAKSILTGQAGPVDEAQGSTADLVSGDEVIGQLVRTRAGVKPVVVSIGHRIDLPSAVQLVLGCTQGYRLPEPTRLADRLASNRD